MGHRDGDAEQRRRGERERPGSIARGRVAARSEPKDRLNSERHEQRHPEAIEKNGHAELDHGFSSYSRMSCLRRRSSSDDGLPSSTSLKASSPGLSRKKRLSKCPTADFAACSRSIEG